MTTLLKLIELEVENNDYQELKMSKRRSRDPKLARHSI